jgi:hypothetical protein
MEWVTEQNELKPQAVAGAPARHSSPIDVRIRLPPAASQRRTPKSAPLRRSSARVDRRGANPDQRLTALIASIVVVSRCAPVPVAALRTLALGYQHLHAPRFVPPETFERARLTRAEQTLDGHVTSLYASYLQRAPWFQDANLQALSGPRVRAPIRPSCNG